MLQTYILIKVFYCSGLAAGVCDRSVASEIADEESMGRRLQMAGNAEEGDATLPLMSLMASFLSTTMSIAMLPQDVFYKCVSAVFDRCISLFGPAKI